MMNDVPGAMALRQWAKGAECVGWLMLASGLAVLFWRPLLGNAGFVGGDIYTYFFPLRHFYQQGLQQGELRLWHSGIGNGVSVVGESQTGAFYPPYLLAYSRFDLNTAYNYVLIGHYALAFVGAVGLARSWAIGWIPAALSALVYVYGWFPTRACLEWAIVTGAWTPISLWATTQLLRTGHWRWGWMLAAATALQLLAGHFQLAFISLLAVGILLIIGPTSEHRRRGLGLLFVTVGYLLALGQLLPTWELKRISQRAQDDFAHSVAYGRVPHVYFAQLVVPWLVYPQCEHWIEQAGNTNKIEAHLYFGLAPLAILTIGLLGSVLQRRRTTAASWSLWPWVVMLAAGLILASGAGFEYLSRLPGFGYFRYPGRYGLLAQIAAAVLAGRFLHDWIQAGRLRLFRHMTALVITGATFFDLAWVGWLPAVNYVTVVTGPPINDLPRCEVFRRLTATDRVFAVSSNILALSNAACCPSYLGLSPAAYLDAWKTMPNIFTGKIPAEPAAQAPLQRMGVTHLLTEQALPADWPVKLLWSGYDPFLHRCLGRSPTEPYWLYRYQPVIGRAFVRDPVSRQVRPEANVSIKKYSPHHIEIATKLNEVADVVLTDLQFPGWQATLDDQPIANGDEPLFRSVRVPAGEHRIVWRYRPSSVIVGFGVAGLIMICLMGLTLRHVKNASILT